MAAGRAGASFLGFIIGASSPRKISIAHAHSISSQIIDRIARVAVTVNASDELLGAIMTGMSPDYIQCHGDESPERVAEVHRLFKVKTIKAVKIKSKADLYTALSYENIADYILLDAKPPSDSKQQGGHGLSFDWRLLKGFKCETPLILAGGLSPENIKIATTTGIKIFDVSSGVETSPGVKDTTLIYNFMIASREKYND